jgi:hypothetical protein
MANLNCSWATSKFRLVYRICEALTISYHSSVALQPFAGPWPLFQFHNLFYTVGRTPWTNNQPVARPLPTQDNTNRINANTDIHALSGIRTHNPSVRASEDSSCLRPRGRCYWRGFYQSLKLSTHSFRVISAVQHFLPVMFRSNIPNTLLLVVKLHGALFQSCAFGAGMFWLFQNCAYVLLGYGNNVNQERNRTLKFKTLRETKLRETSTASIDDYNFQDEYTF